MIFLFASRGLAFYCFVFNFCCVFFQKDEKPDTAKTPKKNKMQKTGQNNQLAQLCSQIVFLDFLGWVIFNLFCAVLENLILNVEEYSLKQNRYKELGPFFDLKRKFLDQVLTLKPLHTWHIYIEYCIYIYAVELKTGPRFGALALKLVQV